MRGVEAVDLPLVVDEHMQSWDCAFKDPDASDHVVGQMWGGLGAYRFLQDQIRARLDRPATV